MSKFWVIDCTEKEWYRSTFSADYLIGSISSATWKMVEGNVDEHGDLQLQEIVWSPLPTDENGTDEYGEDARGFLWFSVEEVAESDLPMPVAAAELYMEEYYW